MAKPKTYYKSKQLTLMLKALGANLKEARERAELSQTELAKQSGVALATIGNLESRRVDDFKGSTVAILAETLKMKYFELLIPSDLIEDLSPEDKKLLLEAHLLMTRVITRLAER